MKRVTRRGAVLAGISATGLGSLLKMTEAARADTPAAKQALFVIGPFSQGDRFKTDREEREARVRSSTACQRR